jgi:hypothetical protein
LARTIFALHRSLSVQAASLARRSSDQTRAERLHMTSGLKFILHDEGIEFFSQAKVRP